MIVRKQEDGYLNNSQFEHSKKSDLSCNDRIDICNLHIDMDAPAEIRAAQYIKQINNPYAFRCDNLAVNVVFSPDGKKLEDALLSYLTMLKKS